MRYFRKLKAATARRRPTAATTTPAIKPILILDVDDEPLVCKDDDDLSWDAAEAIAENDASVPTA